MNLGELSDELAARGFDYLSDTRRKRYINRGYTMLCDEESWPFLEQTTTSAAPITFTDLRAILWVIDSDNGHSLTSVDQRTVRERDPLLEATGNPEQWYLVGDVLNTYPTSTKTLVVGYVGIPTELSDAGDEPVVPTRYHNLIVDAAVYLAHKDIDEYEQAAEVRALWDSEVVSMREKLMDRDFQGNKIMVNTRDWWDRGV